jgi:hypothetical protein
MSRNILFISVDTIKDRTGLHFNVDPKLVFPDILFSQDSQILPALGSSLYNRLQTGIENNDLNPNEQTLLDEYIAPALVYFTMAELPVALSFQFYNKGVIRKTDTNQSEPSASELAEIADRYQTRAEYYKQRLIKYLKEKSGFNTFPQYNNPGDGIDTIWPENNGYQSQIWLGDDCDKYTKKDILNGKNGNCCWE